MLVMGIGLGLTMQMLVIAVQNCLPPQDMGLSTSSVTFFRSMGGTLGAAVSLGVLFGTVRDNIHQRVAEAHLGPVDLLSLKNLSLEDTTTLSSLSEPARRVVLSGFADSMHTVFLVVAAVVVPAFIGTFFIREVPLRDESGLEATRTAEDQGERAMAETAIV
jgi:hypothetical protein